MLEVEGATKTQALLGSEILLTGQSFRRTGNRLSKGSWVTVQTRALLAWALHWLAYF